VIRNFLQILTRLYIPLLLMSLFSCAGNLRLNMDRCETSESEFANTKEEFTIDKSFTAKVWSFGLLASQVNDIPLKDLLREQAISCVNVKYLRYTIGQSFWDQLLSVVPYIQRSSIKIEVMKTKDTTAF
jgi:hypothetical protein